MIKDKYSKKKLASHISVEALPVADWTHITRVRIAQFADPWYFRILDIQKPIRAEITQAGEDGWRIGPTDLKEFAQDGGEPSGTAGLPILNQLKSFDVVNSDCVVVRYYGGTNLGKSGLINAYGHSAERCLQKADLQPIQLIWKLCLNYPYTEQNAIEQLVHQFNLKKLESTYTEEVRLILGCPVEHKTALENRLNQLAHRNIEARFLEESYL
ncbi:MAG TPA: YigZ family protein [Fodinibius sp.]|nr:YigZ family protein [Fodinibius sp.]